MAVDIPNYRVVEKLGIGAQTRIFRARCMRTGKDYAIKIVKAATPEEIGLIDLLRTEHAIGSSLDHPVIRKVYELRMLRRRLRVHGAILFMEYVDGISLSDKAFRRPLNQVLQIFTDVAQGLHAMHQAGFVHADLKPNNLMLMADGKVKLIDLGQSSKMNEPKPRIQGTIDYMAPEQVQRGVLDRRTDVFGLGATLYKVLTGAAIRTEMNQTISMNSQGLVGKRMGDSDGQGIEELPSVVARFMEDCCQDDPNERIQDMPTVIQRLELCRTSMAKRAETARSIDESDDKDWKDDDFYLSDDPIDVNESGAQSNDIEPPSQPSV